MTFDFKSREGWGYLLTPLFFVLSLFPFVSSGAALLLGILVALVFGNPYLSRTRKLTKPLLAWAIVGLGGGVNLFVILQAGTSGILITLCFLSATLFVGYWLSRWLQLSKEMATLISVGTAICGGSAIVAVASAIRAKDDSISVSLGTVFVLNAVALFIFPSLGHFFGLTQDQFGMWAAIAIHDTSSVVGATMQYGERALEIGTTVKLVRALWIIPIALLFAKFYVQDKSPSTTKPESRRQYPWFVVGFVVMSALVTSIEFLQPIGQQIEWIARRVLVATLFLIGSGLTLSALRAVGAKTLLHGLVLWILVSTTSLIILLSL